MLACEDCGRFLFFFFSGHDCFRNNAECGVSISWIQLQAIDAKKSAPNDFP